MYFLQCFPLKIRSYFFRSFFNLLFLNSHDQGFVYIKIFHQALDAIMNVSTRSLALTFSKCEASPELKLVVLWLKVKVVAVVLNQLNQTFYHWLPQLLRVGVVLLVCLAFIISLLFFQR